MRDSCLSKKCRFFLRSWSIEDSKIFFFCSQSFSNPNKLLTKTMNHPQRSTTIQNPQQLSTNTHDNPQRSTRLKSSEKVRKISTTIQNDPWKSTMTQNTQQPRNNQQWLTTIYSDVKWPTTVHNDQIKNQQGSTTTKEITQINHAVSVWSLTYVTA